MNDQPSENKAPDSSVDPAVPPKFPWDIPSKTAAAVQEDDVPSSATASSFAQAGKIDILEKIGRLRQELRKSFAETDELKKRVAELEGECADLRNQVESSKNELGSYIEKMAVRETANLSQTEELRNQIRLLENDKTGLVKQLKLAEATITEISSSLDIESLIPG